jgi:hypothetical protein
MTVLIANTANNNTFDYWRNRTNELAYAMSVYAVTANGSNAAVGNAAITGMFSANSLILTHNANVGTYISVGNFSAAESNSAYVNTTFMHVGNVSVNSTVNAIAMKTFNVYVGSNVVVNTSQLFIGESVTNTVHDKWRIVFHGNSTVNTVANSTTVQITKDAISSVLTFDTLWVGNSVINATMVTTANVEPTGFTANTTTFMLGPNVYANNTTLVLGYTSTSNVLSNSTFIDVRSPTGNVKINSTLISLANSSSVANLASDYLRIGNSYVNSTIITTGNVTVNTTAIVVGNLNSPVVAITARANNVTAIGAESNSNIALSGRSNSSTGVYGISVSGYGVSGISNSSIAVYGVSNTNWAGYFVSNTGNPFYVGNATIEFARITSGGRLGIGNSNPTHDLSVNGTIFALTSVAVSGNFLTNTSGIYHTGTANVNTLTSGSNSGTATAITGYSGSLYGVYGISNTSFGVYGFSNSSYGVYGVSNTSTGVDGRSTSGYGGSFISTSGLPLYAGNNTTEFFRVTPTGNVGVGSGSSSDSKFRVYDATTNTGIRITFNGTSVHYYDANTHYFRDTAGNIRVTSNTTGVGIGNTTYTDMLAVGGSVYFGTTLQVVTSVNSAAHTVGTASIVNATGFWTTGTTNAAVLSVGSAVIGNTSGLFVANSLNTNNVNVGAGTSNSVVNSTALIVRNVSTSTIVNTSIIQSTGNINVSGAAIQLGTAGGYANIAGNMYVRDSLYVTTSVNSASYTVGTATIVNTAGFWTTGTTNAAVLSVGSAVIGNTSGLFVSNSVNTNTVNLGAGSSNSVVNSTALIVRNSSTSTIVNTSIIQSSGNVNISGAAVQLGVAGGYANVAGDMFVRGNLQVSGNLTYTGVATGDINPFGNNFNLGNLTNRWGLFAGAIVASANITTSHSLLVNNQIVLGNTSTTSYITIVPPNNTERTQGNTFLSANGSWGALPTLPISNSSVTTTGTSAQVIDSVLLSTNDAYEWLINVIDNVTTGRRHATKIIATCNSSAMVGTEYATIFNVASLGTFTVTSNATHGIVQYTPVPSSTTVAFTRINA